MKHNVVALVVLLLAAAGCLSQGDGHAPPEDSMGGLFGAPAHAGATPKETAAGKEPNPSQDSVAEPTPARAPVTFSGRILAPDLSHWDYGSGCPGYGGLYSLAGNGTIHVNFDLRESYDDWSFMFDSSGFDATFSGGRGRGSGPAWKVPPGSTSVTVCSRHAVNADFVLTLVPPTWIVFSGHVLTPHAKGCEGQAVTDRLSSQWFALDRRHDGSTFGFNEEGLVARFYSTKWSPWSTSGVVPDGAEAVVVCSRAAVDADFRLILTPAGSHRGASAVQHHAGAWEAGLVRPNAPCFSSGLPVPSDPYADGVLYDSFRINPATRGQPYKIVVTNDAASTGAGGIFLSFYDSTGKAAGTSSTTKESDGRIRRLVPQDAMLGVFWSCETGPVRADYFAGL